MLEIGQVYRHHQTSRGRGQLYLAVDEDIVLTFVRRRGRSERALLTAAQVGPLVATWDVPVSQLARRWGITLERLDAETGELIGAPERRKRAQVIEYVPVRHKVAKMRRRAS